MANIGRDSGYYWVRDDNQYWYVLFYDCEQLLWELRDDMKVNDTFFREIYEERILNPSEKTYTNSLTNKK